MSDSTSLLQQIKTKLEEMDNKLEKLEKEVKMLSHKLENIQRYPPIRNLGRPDPFVSLRHQEFLFYNS